jgi:DNA-directed RNA polymerase specialized sigma24 family protein
MASWSSAAIDGSPLSRTRGILGQAGFYQKASTGAGTESLLYADRMALDDALLALETVHPRKSQVVELRFFGGLSVEETAEALHVSVDTVKRDWRFAKLWLLRELGGEGRRHDA